MENNTLESIILRREEVLNQVRDLFITELQLDLTREEIDPDTTLFATGLGLDSVDAVVIIVELENKFGIKISEQESRSALRSVNTLVDIIIEKSGNV